VDIDIEVATIVYWASHIAAPIAASHNRGDHTAHILTTEVHTLTRSRRDGDGTRVVDRGEFTIYAVFSAANVVEEFTVTKIVEMIARANGEERRIWICRFAASQTNLLTSYQAFVRVGEAMWCGACHAHAASCKNQE